jgi:hypothetical protein
VRAVRGIDRLLSEGSATSGYHLAVAVHPHRICSYFQTKGHSPLSRQDKTNGIELFAPYTGRRERTSSIQASGAVRAGPTRTVPAARLSLATKSDLRIEAQVNARQRSGSPLNSSPKNPRWPRHACAASEFDTSHVSRIGILEDNLLASIYSSS